MWRIMKACYGVAFDCGLVVFEYSSHILCHSNLFRLVFCPIHLLTLTCSHEFLFTWTPTEREPAHHSLGSHRLGDRHGRRHAVVCRRPRCRRLLFRAHSALLLARRHSAAALRGRLAVAAVSALCRDAERCVRAFCQSFRIFPEYLIM